jgi:phosphatidylethanolamine/phosphatidyl-N-methylethanolamine N-methyltransferase
MTNPYRRRTLQPARDVLVRDIVSFLRAWFADPLRVAAITPSGTALANLVTREISAATGPVLELGAGTGVFTRALLARGVPEGHLTLLEYGADFAQLLSERFPHARVLSMDAARLAHAPLFEGAPVGAVISGLPLLYMSPKKVVTILKGAFGYLRRGGSFYQFTYMPRCPISYRLLKRLGLEATRIGGTLRNVPPAAVYRISRIVPSAS